MYYHFQIFDVASTNECRINLSLDELTQRLIVPYENGTHIVVNGRAIKLDQINRIRIFETEANLDAIVDKFQSEYEDDPSPYKMLRNSPTWDAIETGKDVTDKYIIGPPGSINRQEPKLKEAGITSIKKIFISHSSKDKSVVGELINLLEAIGLISDQIFCSSFEGYGTPLGADFLARLKSELDSGVLVLFILSRNFYASPISLCEMGATWIKTKKHIPILIPPFQFEGVRGVFPLTQGMLINDKDKLNSLKEVFEMDFNLSPIKLSIWEKKRGDFLKNIRDVNEIDYLEPSSEYFDPEIEIVEELDEIRNQLSLEAKNLLKEASLDTSGQIIKLPFTIETNGKQMNEDSPRSKAMWIAAFNELLIFNLIQEVGYEGEIFNLTDTGYKVADKIN